MSSEATKEPSISYTSLDSAKDEFLNILNSPLYENVAAKLDDMLDKLKDFKLTAMHHAALYHHVLAHKYTLAEDGVAFSFFKLEDTSANASKRAVIKYWREAFVCALKQDLKLLGSEYQKRINLLKWARSHPLACEHRDDGLALRATATIRKFIQPELKDTQLLNDYSPTARAMPELRL